MNFNKHSNLEGQHAFLGASKYHWLNYDDEALIRSYINSYAQTIGTLLHEYAQKRITFKLKVNSNSSERNAIMLYLQDHGVPKTVINLGNGVFENLACYVNDAIGFRMSPEIILYYSDFCYGTADSISFRDDVLRIHDLKTGFTTPSMHQLQVYAALFCLQYKVKPSDIGMELRIYQSGQDIQIYTPTPETICGVIDKITNGNKVINKLRQE